MVALQGISSLLLWAGFILMILLFLFLDLFLFNRKHQAVSIKKALIWTAVWFTLAMLFNAVVWYIFGADAGLTFFTGYLIEKALSVDNLFVMIVIFASFKILPKYQHEILFFGILS